MMTGSKEVMMSWGWRVPTAAIAEPAFAVP